MDSAQNNEINNNNASINGKDSFLDYIVSIGYEPKDYLEVKVLANEGMTEVLEHYFKVFHTK